MVQRTITYSRSVTVTHTDDCPLTDEQILEVIGHDGGTSEESAFGIFVVEDDISNMGSCTTNISEESH